MSFLSLCVLCSPNVCLELNNFFLTDINLVRLRLFFCLNLLNNGYGAIKGVDYLRWFILAQSSIFNKLVMPLVVKPLYWEACNIGVYILFTVIHTIIILISLLIKILSFSIWKICLEFQSATWEWEPVLHLRSSRADYISHHAVSVKPRKRGWSHKNQFGNLM